MAAQDGQPLENPLGNIENDHKLSRDVATTTIDQTTNIDNTSSQGTQLKILAPAMTRDMTLPSTGKKVPMVMVPVPDTGHLIAIPLSTINQLKDSNQVMEMDCITKDEQQARDLLTWNDGIGTLDGCDLRFKINDFGYLELIDSDDEYIYNKPAPAPRPVQISPGSSLLRDGPDKRRPKSSSSIKNHQSNSISLLKLLSEKIVPKQKLDEIKTNVEQWTIEDVRDFINSIPGCDGYGELFESQQICGKSLMYLDQRDLLDIINVKLGPAVKIHYAISLLKS